MRTALVLLFFVLIATVARASEEAIISGRDRAYQFEKQTLEGSEWEGFLPLEGVVMLRFEHGSVLRYRYYTDAREDSKIGNWWREGKSLYVRRGNGTLLDRYELQGDRLIGKRLNPEQVPQREVQLRRHLVVPGNSGFN